MTAAPLGSIWTKLTGRTPSRSGAGVLGRPAACVIRFAGDDRGQDLIEYALLLGFIGLALLGSGIHFASTRDAAKNQAGFAGS